MGRSGGKGDGVRAKERGRGEGGEVVDLQLESVGGRSAVCGVG